MCGSSIQPSQKLCCYLCLHRLKISLGRAQRGAPDMPRLKINICTQLCFVNIRYLLQATPWRGMLVPLLILSCLWMVIKHGDNRLSQLSLVWYPSIEPHLFGLWLSHSLPCIWNYIFIRRKRAVDKFNLSTGDREVMPGEINLRARII